MTLAITSYQWFLSIHILAATLWVGANFTMGVFGARTNPETDPAGAAKLLRDSAFIGHRILAPLSLILLVLGFILIGKGNWDYDLWVIFGLFVWAFTFANGIGYLGRKAVPIAEGLERGDFASVASDYRGFVLASRIELTLLILVVLDMTLKPGS
jgi:putative copper export protein